MLKIMFYTVVLSRSTIHTKHGSISIIVNGSTRDGTFEIVNSALAVCVFQRDRLARYLIAFDLVQAFLRADEPVFAAQHQTRSVDDGEEELLLGRDVRADGV